MEPTIILVAGYAASGKTRVGKEISRRIRTCCYLDKDTVSGPLVDRLLLALGSALGDRASDVYRQEVRPLEYRCLLDAGFEAVECGVSALLSAPFLHQLVDANWNAWLRDELLKRGVPSQIIWVHCTRAVLHNRMIARGSARDQEKIANWDDYAASIDEKFQTRIPSAVIEFDNNDESTFEAQISELVGHLQESYRRTR